MCVAQWVQQVLLEHKVTKPCAPSTAAHADVSCAMQVCKAVSGLHQREIVHGDLRPANVMWFSSSFSMKLVDFARWSDKGMPTPLNITLTCAAPEVCVCFSCLSCSTLLTLTWVCMRFSLCSAAAILSVSTCIALPAIVPVCSKERCTLAVIAAVSWAACTRQCLSWLFFVVFPTFEFMLLSFI